MSMVPVFDRETNIPEELAGLTLERAGAVDALDPGVGWDFRYHVRFPDGGWIGTNVLMYDRDERVGEVSSGERAKAEYERSAGSFANYGATDGEYQDLTATHHGFVTSLAPRLSSRWRQLGFRLFRRGESPDPDLDEYPMKDPGWWWTEFQYLADGERFVTHLILRVDAGLFQKLLYTYAASNETGHASMMDFAEGWRRALIKQINAPAAPADLPDFLNEPINPVIVERAPAMANALGNLNEKLRENPRDIKSWMARGTLYQAMGLAEDAIASYDRVIGVDPHHADALASMGQLFASNGSQETAHGCFTMALETDPNHVEALIGAGLLRYLAGDTHDALGYYTRALNVDETSGKAWHMKGLALGDLDQAEEAQRCREKAKALGFEVPA